MGRRRNSALRKEQDHQFSMITNKQAKTFYQKHDHKPETNMIPFNPMKVKRQIELVPKTINQENYILALTNPDTDVVVVSGPAGTGKTYLAMLAAIKSMRSKECERIVLCRPSISIEDENHGFLPGDLNSKLEPWVKPMIDVLREYYSMKEIEHMLAEQIIEFAPLGMMRGRTFKNTWIFADEMQNGTPTQFKMLLTRIGQGSKIIIGGDVEQTDRKKPDNGLMDFKEKIQRNPIKGIELCEFDRRDIQRHRIIDDVLTLYKYNCR